jgi:hypothetical protein
MRKAVVKRSGTGAVLFVDILNGRFDPTDFHPKKGISVSVLLRLALLVVAGTAIAGPSVAWALEPLLHDDFSTLSLPQRRAIRGEWLFTENSARCTQSDELYKKYKNHGPIIFYDLSLNDARIRFAFRAEGVKSVVFTANGEEGHIARVIWAPKGMTVRAFPPNSVERSVTVADERAPLATGKWVPVEIALKGHTLSVKVGDSPAKTYEHPSFARPKTNLSVGFAFGTLALRDFVVEPGTASR